MLLLKYQNDQKTLKKNLKKNQNLQKTPFKI